ncbi:MAG TPA: pentapeptide repeat-containing protein, partial [Candidatus Binatia bacterium]
MAKPDTATEHSAPPANADELLERYLAGERNFAAAQLANADLSGADLRGANFSDADLTDAILEHADLSNGNFQGATLLRTVLRGANLENADFTKVTGLLPAQLAGTNLGGVRLPDRFGDFDGLRVVEEESKNARTLFIGTLLACVYGWLTIASTTDVLLLTNSSSSPLPIIGASIPIVSFFVVGPLMLFLLYIYLHLHLQRLWERLADLPAVFPDGRSLGKRAYPWLLTGLVYSFNPYLKDRRPPLSQLQAGVSLLVAWWLMPLTITLFWGRYLRRHDWTGTTLHIVVLV